MKFFTGTNVNIILDTGINVASASSAKINYKKPSGATGSWTASVSGNNVTYETLVSDINESGIWMLQTEVVISGDTLKGDFAKFKVFASLV